MEQKFPGNFLNICLHILWSRFLISHLKKMYCCRRQRPRMRKIKFISLFCILSLILEGIFGRENSLQECQNVALILWHYVCIANIEIDWKCQILTFIHLAFVCTVLHLYSSIRISKICRIAFLKFSKFYSLFLLFVIILKILLFKPLLKEKMLHISFHIDLKQKDLHLQTNIVNAVICWHAI